MSKVTWGTYLWLFKKPGVVDDHSWAYKCNVCSCRLLDCTCIPHTTCVVFTAQRAKVRNKGKRIESDRYTEVYIPIEFHE